MRKRKDPGIRREVFISTATDLFMEKGYEAVSVRDVLNAVADKTASPSVFYYYFSSKDELYRTCVGAVAHSYLASMREAFSAEGKTVSEWMIGLVSALEESLMSDRNLIRTGDSSLNRMFILDMREQVTGEMAELWTGSLETSFGIPASEARILAQFLAGGVGESMYQFMQSGRYDQKEVFAFTESAVRFVMNAIGLPGNRKEPLEAALQEKHGRILE